jgi:hypothetical protein
MAKATTQPKPADKIPDVQPVPAAKKKKMFNVKANQACTITVFQEEDSLHADQHNLTSGQTLSIMDTVRNRDAVAPSVRMNTITILNP